MLLSSLKGKIVVMPFMFTTCPHCQREAQMLTTLQKEFAGRGVVMVGTVFNDANGAMAAQFVKEFHIGFPVGYATRDSGDQLPGPLGAGPLGGSASRHHR